ncbi:hypothetical protein VS84_01495 [Vibrio cholerae]|nr:hypothetical protein VS84_01495 [Vibrio cholerae]KKP21802.1 hypothetical protein VS86_01766 [Vibrio cholerae]
MSLEESLVNNSGNFKGANSSSQPQTQANELNLPFRQKKLI